MTDNETLARHRKPGFPQLGFRYPAARDVLWAGHGQHIDDDRPVDGPLTVKGHIVMIGTDEGVL